VTASPSPAISDPVALALSSPDAAARVRAAVEAVEAGSAAEVVVCVRAASAEQREADHRAGALLALATLLFLLYVPWEYELHWFPLELGAAYLLGGLLARHAPGLRRRLLPAATLDAAVDRAASAAFHDLGVHQTSGRTGVLVFVSRFERRARLVADRGVDRAALGAAWVEATQAVQAAAATDDAEPLVRALEALGAELAVRLPREADDVDELPNEVRA
jgi:putative membrane protein